MSDPNESFRVKLDGKSKLKFMLSDRPKSVQGQSLQDSPRQDNTIHRHRRPDDELIVQKKGKINIYDLAQISDGSGGWTTPFYNVDPSDTSGIVPLANAPLAFSLSTWSTKYRKIDPDKYRISIAVNSGDLKKVKDVPLTDDITNLFIYPSIDGPTYPIYDAAVTSATLVPIIGFEDFVQKITSLPSKDADPVTFKLLKKKPFDIYINPAIFKASCSDNSVFSGTGPTATTEDLPYPDYKWLGEGVPCPFEGAAGHVSVLHRTESWHYEDTYYRTNCIIWDRSYAFSDPTTTTDGEEARHRQATILSSHGLGTASRATADRTVSSNALIRTDGFIIFPGDYVCPDYVVGPPIDTNPSLTFTTTAFAFHDYDFDEFDSVMAPDQLIAVIVQGTTVFYLWNTF